MNQTLPSSLPVDAVPSDDLLSTAGPFDFALLGAGLFITILLAIGFILLLRGMKAERE